jgi:endonuclease/exonuclease/phosphatase family metal-dependent hydrolase
MRTPRRTITIFACWLLPVLLCACGNPADSTAFTNGEIELRVMTFNIEWGGTRVSFDKVREAIILANADIVGIQEAEGNLQRLAVELGWHYDLRNYVISKYPVIEPPGADGNYAFVEVAAGRIVAISNVHLPSDPYGPDAVRDGAGAGEVLAIERRARLPKMLATLDALQPLLVANVPLFMTGDFNAPAHTDWTAAAVGTRPFLRYALEWPVSIAVKAAGFHDSWRDVHANELTNPGLTWWAPRPPIEGYVPDDNDARDRIDFIWYSGSVSVQGSELVGETGGPEVSIGVSPWPSDHRAIVSTFFATPAATPALVSTARRVYREGDDIDVIYRQLRDADIQLARVSDAGGESPVASRRVTGDGTENFDAELFEPAQYRVSSRDAGKKTVMSRDFWVLDKAAIPQLEVRGDVFDAGEGIDVRWRNAPGNRNDYLALVPADAQTGNEMPWAYVAALPHGEIRLDSATAEWGWPPPPGQYVIRLFEDDGYEQLAESAVFTINAASAEPAKH